MKALEEIFAFQAHEDSHLEHVKDMLAKNPMYDFSKDDTMMAAEAQIKSVNEHVADTFRKTAYYWLAELFSQHHDEWKEKRITYEMRTDSNREFVKSEIERIGKMDAKKVAVNIKDSVLSGMGHSHIRNLLKEVTWLEEVPNFSSPVTYEMGELKDANVFSVISSLPARNALGMHYGDFKLRYELSKAACFEGQMHTDDMLKTFSKHWTDRLNPVVGYICMSGPFDTAPVSQFLESSFNDLNKINPADVTVKRRLLAEYFGIASLK